MRTYASAVVTALTDLQGYLSAAVNPDRMALADLEMESMGWTRKVYSDKAFQIWKRQLDLFPDDPLILHHMAIMHHARAFDIEIGPKPAESNADWKVAMSYWHKLHKTDAFWDKLTAKACAGTVRQDDVQKLREDFPQMILAMHYDIALDKETREKRKSRVKFHIKLVHDAPFKDEEIAKAQRSAYNRYIKVVPDEVWQSEELREEMLAKGHQAIIEYLNYDPGCIPALEDALRLQLRLQRSRVTAWRAIDKDDPKRNSILLREKKDAQAWRPFFDQLIARVDKLDEEVREDLARWYQGRGSALCALDEDENAIDLFERAVDICRPDDDGRRLYVRELVQTQARVACDKAFKEETGAKAYCDKIRRQDDLTIIACLLLAQAYTRLKEFNVAMAVCDRGLAIEPDFDDLEADEFERQLSEFKQEIPIAKKISAATDSMKAGRFNDALLPLNKAEKQVKAADRLRQHKNIYWLRGQAHMAVGNIADAMRDAQTLADLAETERDREQVKRLNEMISQEQSAASVKQLLDEAESAMKNQWFNQALVPLNKAAELAPDLFLVFFLRSQAHMGMGNITAARRDARKSASLAKTERDRELAEHLNELINQEQGAASIRHLLDNAKSSIENQLFSQALKSLNEAAKLAPDVFWIYYLRFQANILSGNFNGAMNDYQEAKELAKSPEEKKALDQMAGGFLKGGL